MGSPAVSSKKPSLPPVKDFKKSKRDTDNNAEDNKYFPPSMPFISRGVDSLLPLDVKIEREYDPLWPNDYEKVVKEMREAAAAKRTSEDPVEDRDTDSPGGDKKRRYLVQSMGKARERFQAASGNTQTRPSGFSARPGDDDEAEDEERGGARKGLGGGAAIAPPPSLTASSESPPPAAASVGPLPSAGMAAGKGLGFAAKLMAKYGYKEGGGLGKGLGFAAKLMAKYGYKEG